MAKVLISEKLSTEIKNIKMTFVNIRCDNSKK